MSAKPKSLRELAKLTISKHEAIPIASWHEVSNGSFVADDPETAFKKWQSNFADDVMQVVIKARMVELDLLEQAINAGWDMNAFKMHRLEKLKAELREAGDVS